MTFQTQGEPRRMTMIMGITIRDDPTFLGADVERAGGRPF
jgi:hypothetical protein